MLKSSSVSTSRTSFGSLPQGLVSFLLLSLACSTSTKAASFDCKFELQGKNFDLTALDKPVTHVTTIETPPTTLKDTYAVNPCSALPRDSNLQGRDQCPEGTRACLTIVNQKTDEPDRIVSVVPVATGELDPKLSYAVAAKGKPATLSIALHGGKYNDRPRWANLTMICDPTNDSTEPSSWNFRRTDQEGILSVEWVTKHACPLDSQGSPDAGGGAKNGTSIAGLVGDFILLLLVVLVVYFAAGAYHQYSRYGSRGWDLIPHRAFWADVPYVLRDLFRGTGRNSSGYSAL
ncbi:hypothetical protein P389DRAFT_168421 [Cystobasidium minutum MCA 4210]|uniref:uncharacterized protein n=1 Tax=Cystobasidium minutum MCA 4210 TaxID=1397322 RepID=UPI0034D00270|eukprot:jgi/Rhomi1/168421/fgenesh1_kg.2_\